MFREGDYNENVEYCRYVFDINNRHNIGLAVPDEIQYVANQYAEELAALDIYEYMENEELLFDIIRELGVREKAESNDLWGPTADFDPEMERGQIADGEEFLYEMSHNDIPYRGYNADDEPEEESGVAFPRL